MKVLRVRNVNEALEVLRRDAMDGEGWVVRNSRLGSVIEYDEPVATVYDTPMERVSFSRARDANPFFHLFEALWIMAGREDVAFLTIFNKRMSEYSDDGVRYHAAYGHRLRNSIMRIGSHGLTKVDQLKEVWRILAADTDSRRAVLSIWDAARDLGVQTKDLPCNDMVFFKVRDNMLDMTVCCRSNDAIWGAYGTNVVQFSVIQEVLASSLALGIGQYTQVSDSLHIYDDNEAWKRMCAARESKTCKYQSGEVRPFPMVTSAGIDSWLLQAEALCHEIEKSMFITLERYTEGFFTEVAIPMWKAWHLYQHTNLGAALSYLETLNLEIDWLRAGYEWLGRRVR